MNILDFKKTTFLVEFIIIILPISLLFSNFVSEIAKQNGMTQSGVITKAVNDYKQKELNEMNKQRQQVDSIGSMFR